MSFLENLARLGLMKLNAERAHLAGVKALKRGAVKATKRVDSVVLRSDVAGITFPNPLGIAAGFDKNAEVPDALMRRGMGFSEVGTVTPLPQEGNPKPRVFRLPEEKAVINRLGFNNEGHDVVKKRLVQRRKKGGIVGVNIGANKTSDDFIGDYIKGIRKFADVATYFTANISSPNTPGLRDLQGAAALRQLLTSIRAERDEVAVDVGYKVPIFLKIAPDVSDREIEQIAGEVLDSGIEGLIVSNTTVSRENIAEHELAIEAGGLSGAPVFEASTLVLAKMRRAVGPNMPIIGVGGITDGASALQKIKAGANLLQVYTGLIYGGFDLIDEIKDTLEEAVRAEKASSVADLVSTDTERLLKDH